MTNPPTGQPPDGPPPGSRPPGNGDPQPQGGPPDGPPTPPPDDGDDYVVGINNVRALPSDEPGQLNLEVETTRGTVQAFIHPCEGKTGCAVFIGGAGGGNGAVGPADEVYVRLGRELVAQGVTSVRLIYREAGEFTECVLDTLAVCSVLKGLGAQKAVIVGHSFGGAVAIKAGELAPIASAVVGMSSQRYGTQDVERLGKPLLLIHGADDQVLLPEASEDIFGRAQEPKRMVILEGAGHGLREASDDVYNLLTDYIVRAVGDAADEQ